ncbi:ADP-ribose pyrophosphatase YjhB (NUDIX family) [Brevibacterium sanguinis]|uniref:ADP-ribose pyrophosphatase YjhB (NUDIX family) n=2 Tax=Brevibacterium TaxID=1696 RepID=A0A366IIY4_9MICO|nr:MULTISPECIES: NUDIX domain-containing protein [Brevibacterium]RBP65477.1 ADP-ribose pyrophosphatase YjhB (NUDIX family) [Brevibacterium sanguinis]RBP72111.1 ADP-ribose pyrophosphatase YjhB (NUDIX family) [Brevibacterium celere]
MNDIHVSALVITHPERRELLMVRKANTTSFMLPGGKPEPGEDAEATIIREANEELGLSLDPANLDLLGTFAAAAANEAGHRVVGTVFHCRGVPEGLDVERIGHRAEIEEAGWFPYDPMPEDTPQRQFAPLTRVEVVPAMLASGLLIASP